MKHAKSISLGQLNGHLFILNKRILIKLSDLFAFRYHKCSVRKLKLYGGVEERKCIICNNVEDEFHFILECTKYNEIRRKYIKYFWQRPNIPKFIELMTSTNKMIIRNLASYVYEAFGVRYQ